MGKKTVLAINFSDQRYSLLSSVCLLHRAALKRVHEEDKENESAIFWAYLKKRFKPLRRWDRKRTKAKTLLLMKEAICENLSKKKRLSLSLRKR